jgi:O-antigen/teichoic acid export membrane protein
VLEAALSPLRRRFGSLLHKKLSADIAWTLGSLVVLAGSGIAINVAVAGLRDAAALGAFNLAYAVYLVAAQIALFGLHYSVMRHAALHEPDADMRGKLLLTGGLCALGLGMAMALAIYLAAPLLGRAFDSPLTARAIGHGALGLALFPLNRVLLAYLNGLRHMKAFAMLMSMRYVIVMLWVAGVAASSLPFELATAGFFVAELATTCSAAAYLASQGMLPKLRFDREWVGQHLAFGGKSLLAGLFTELNSRLDVLLVGVLLSDRAAGIYSFAAMLVDGLYHVLAMVRLNFNPVLVEALRDENWDGARRLLKEAKGLFYPAAAGLALAAIAAFYVLAAFVVPGKGLLEGLPALIVLLAGLTLVSAFVPFDNLLVASGHPEYQTLQHLAVISANVVLNLSLVPKLGIVGAATGTALSHVIGILVLVLLVRHLLGWNLVANRVAR